MAVRAELLTPLNFNAKMRWLHSQSFRALRTGEWILGDGGAECSRFDNHQWLDEFADAETLGCIIEKGNIDDPSITHIFSFLFLH